MRAHHTLSILIAILLFGAGFAYVTSPVVSTIETGEYTSETKTAHIIPVLSNTTVIAAMEAYAAAEPTFSFSGRDFSGLGLFVEEINGLKNRDGFYWTLFINNTLSEKGASLASVVPGDIVEWRYQKGI